MDSKVLFNVQYGLFVLAANDGTKDNACIINTVVQVTAAPITKDRISITVTKIDIFRILLVRIGINRISLSFLRVCFCLNLMLFWIFFWFSIRILF